jgi:hypothetical protein
MRAVKSIAFGSAALWAKALLMKKAKTQLTVRYGKVFIIFEVDNSSSNITTDEP